MITEVSRIVVLLLVSGVLVGSALAAPPMPATRAAEAAARRSGQP